MALVTMLLNGISGIGLSALSEGIKAGVLPSFGTGVTSSFQAVPACVKIRHSPPAEKLPLRGDCLSHRLKSGVLSRW